MAKEIDIQVQEAQRVPNKLDPKRNIPRYSIIKIPKVKDKVLKAAREKKRESYKGIPIRPAVDFSKQTLQARREARTYNQDYSIQQSYHLEWKGKIKCFPDKVKLKEFIITKPLLYEMVKGLI